MKNKNIGSSFDDFLKEESLYDHSSAVATARTISRQIQQELISQESCKTEDISDTIMMVVKIFNGDIAKACAWFKAKNPLLGDTSPAEMIHLGRHERLKKFIISSQENIGNES